MPKKITKRVRKLNQPMNSAVRHILQQPGRIMQGIGALYYQADSMHNGHGWTSRVPMINLTSRRETLHQLVVLQQEGNKGDCKNGFLPKG